MQILNAIPVSVFTAIPVPTTAPMAQLHGGDFPIKCQGRVEDPDQLNQTNQCENLVKPIDTSFQTQFDVVSDKPLCKDCFMSNVLKAKYYGFCSDLKSSCLMGFITGTENGRIFLHKCHGTQIMDSDRYVCDITDEFNQFLGITWTHHVTTPLTTRFYKPDGKYKLVRVERMENLIRDLVETKTEWIYV